jgi:hypothetical protein
VAKSKAPIVTAVIVGIVAIVGVKLIVGGASGGSPGGEPTDPARSTGDCVTLSVAASSE